MTPPAPEGDLSLVALVAEAEARAGPWPAGMEVPFRDTLELLVESCLRTGALNATGRTVLARAVVRHLRNLRYLQAHAEGAGPETAGPGPDPPIVVTGLPRTGTTLLHNLLALDPAHRVLRFWEALHPVPPGAGGPSAEVLQAQAERWLDAFHRLAPEFQAIHRATATGPEECDALLQNTFASQHFDDMFDARSYSTWLAEAPLAREYAHYALQLRVLSEAPTPRAGPGTRWALKSPSHLGHLDALLGALPGATVVICHRHPREAVASYASLIHVLRRTYSDAASPQVAGRQALARGARAMERALAVRHATGGAAFADISYVSLVRDPVATVADLYHRLGRPLERSVENRMRAWALEHPQHGHGAHRYDLAGFGLTGAEVDRVFAPYLDRFGSTATG